MKLDAQLILCLLTVSISPKTSFFLTPLRLWEFLIGFYVAKQWTQNGSVVHQKPIVGAAALIALLSIPLVPVDGTATNIWFGHPGLFTVLVVLLTACILACGLPRQLENTLVARAFEQLGQYSYSIYLVHFPVIVLYHYKPFEGTVLNSGSTVDTLVLAVLIAALSFLMYQLVEAPARHKVTLRWLFATPAMLITIAIASTALYLHQFSRAEILIFNAWNDRSQFRCGKIARVLSPVSHSCNLTPELKSPSRRILLIGNSHADAIKTAFASEAQLQNVAVHLTVSNIALMPGGLTAKGVLAEAKRRSIDNIVLHFSPCKIYLDSIAELVNLAGDADIGVYMILPVPVWDRHIPRALYEHLKHDIQLPIQSNGEFISKDKNLRHEFTQLTDGQIKIFSAAPYLCSASCQIISNEGKPYYYDGGHLTLTGSNALRPLFRAVIKSSKNLAADLPEQVSSI